MERRTDKGLEVGLFEDKKITKEPVKTIEKPIEEKEEITEKPVKKSNRK